ncbi:TetR/AcrR family transcriptional regulator [Paenibacillus arenosi]|uniref:TetR/AcrR family transcriptional regulator n=1 Tax=Paenibacillus arenosi TaxID=2774142 RepID=A0ABR9B1E2_9BACL|nr:TetR/AcrR family transcriptional regulator [Paenibacillus arenosi]MBD8499729.1 TetR/AcrR family transcriptional regulator [Paenibacillus arenosi]
MRKGDKTKQDIIMKAAELFNEKGYASCSMQDIMEVTGLTKGGIYGCFSSKEDIALEAFDYSTKLVAERFMTAIDGEATATAKILAMCEVYRDAAHNPPLKGGCPLLNTAVESDQTIPLLREKASEAYIDMLTIIQNILEQGIRDGEYHSEMDTEATASFILSSLEGSIMSSRLTMNNIHIAFVKKNLEYVLISLSKKR